MTAESVESRVVVATAGSSNISTGRRRGIISYPVSTVNDRPGGVIVILIIIIAVVMIAGVILILITVTITIVRNPIGGRS